MRYKKQSKLYSIVAMIVLSVVISVMTISLSYNYYKTKEKLTHNLHKKSLITINRLKNSIAPFMNSYSINEYNELIINGMSNENILSIVVEDYLTTKIIGKDKFFIAKKRDKNWNIIDYNPEKGELNNYFSTNQSSIILEDQEIGKIQIYFTDKFLQEEIENLIINNIITSTIISIVLILSLFSAIHFFILKPINQMILSLNNKNENGLPNSFHIQRGSKEISSLSYSVFTMIHKIRMSQQKIDKLNERFELTLDAVQDGIWDWNLTNDTIYFSKRWKIMLGYQDNEIENSSSVFFNLLHDDDKTRVNETLQKHFENPEKYPYNIEIQLKCKNGDYKWILSRGKVHLDENNKPKRMLGYHTDITKKKEDEELQKKQDKLISEQLKLASMGEMIGNIAHQWRQPLSIISTGATGMQLQKEYNILDDETFHQICESINDNAQYLSQTIDDFRNFIKGESTAIDFNLKDTTDSFINLINSSVKANNINLELDLNENIIINGFPNELIQCFINIFNNAKDALSINEIDEKYIFISQYIKDNMIFIEFKDNAGGISKEVLPKIFEPYFTTKHKFQGTGLGLHMAYQLIVNSMKGTIQAENETFVFKNTTYTGAKFIINIPLKKDLNLE